MSCDPEILWAENQIKRRYMQFQKRIVNTCRRENPSEKGLRSAALNY